MRYLPILLALLLTLPACNGPAPEGARAESKLERPAPTKENRPGEDWPHFLGPRHTGVSAETNILTDWPENGPPVLWSRDVGAGYSAPSIRDGRLVLHHRVGRHEVVECIDAATGETLWTHRYPSNFTDPYGYNNGPRCTPLLTPITPGAPGRCFTYGAEAMLTCLDLNTGDKIWARDLKQDYSLPDWFFGVGCTPILEQGLLIVLVGGQPNSGVVAFNPDTGQSVWEAAGRDTWDGVDTGWPGRSPYEWTGEEQIVSYASPIAADIHGRRHLLCLLRHGLVSLDPKTGRLNFKYWFRSTLHESVNAARPVVVGDEILLAAAYNLGSVLLKVAPDGHSVREVWKKPRLMQAHWSTPLHVDGHVYGFSGREQPEAVFQCLDWKTGKLVWETTGYGGDFNDLAQDPFTGRFVDRTTGKPIPYPFLGRGSKIQVEDFFIVLAERGPLALARINPDRYEELARCQYDRISYPAWTAPVLSHKRLYLRDEDSLLCLDLAPE